MRRTAGRHSGNGRDDGDGGWEVRIDHVALPHNIEAEDRVVVAATEEDSSGIPEAGVVAGGTRTGKDSTLHPVEAYASFDL